jgi:hypothetical protein
LKAGTTFVVRNGDDILHSVIGAKGEFRSKALDTGDRFSSTLAKVGSYGVFYAAKREGSSSPRGHCGHVR